LLNPPQGVYLHGPAGRGKSFLLDGMFDVSLSKVKYRLHFHELMSELNKKINRGEVRLQDVFRDMLPRASLVVIDEVNPLDTATGMFFLGLLDALWNRRCVVCFSSNQSPQNLFAGIKMDAETVQKFTTRLEQSVDVIELAGGEDFRLQKLGAQDLYQYPVTEGTYLALDAIMHLLAEGDPTSAPVPVGSRELPCVKRAPGIAWFDFASICGGPFSYEDYLRIVDEFPTLIVANVPQLRDEDEARRFAWLVEIVYDHKRRLILSAHVAVDDLFAPSLSSRGVEVDFTKIVSRLNEMQSSEYNYSLAQQ
jgi:cell division protein ZapE